MSENNNNAKPTVNTESTSNSQKQQQQHLTLFNNGNFSNYPFPVNHANDNNNNINNNGSRKRSLNAALDINPQSESNQYHKKQRTEQQQLMGLDAYIKLGKLGEGTYGVVYKARDRRTNEFVALKKVRTGLNETKKGFPITSIREIKILQNLNHCNIVRLREVVRSTNIGFVFLVFEYFENDLAHLMDKHMNINGNFFSISEIKCIMLQILSAINYAHSHFVIHRDIKLSNILLSNSGQIVLCDWGLARLFSNPLKKHTAKVVTLWYRAPELLFGCNIYHTAIDIWAIGCIFAELLKHKPLLPGKNDINQIQLIYQLLGAPNHHIWPNYNRLPKILNGTLKDIQSSHNQYKWNQIDSIFANFGVNCLDLMKQLLAYDPSKRITAKNAIKHPFFKQHPLPCTKDMMPTFPPKQALQIKQKK